MHYLSNGAILPIKTLCAMTRFDLHKRFVLLLFLCISFGTCSNDLPDDPATEKPYLTLAGDVPGFDAGGGEAELIFSTNEAWRIEPEATQGETGDWLTVSPLSGKAGAEIKVTLTADPNEEYEGRSVTLVLHTESLEERIPVAQLKKNVILLDDRNRYEVSAEAQTLTVKVRSNVDYAVEIAEGGEWLDEQDPSRAGLTEREHTFRIAANPAERERTGKIVFQDRDTDLSDVLTVVQAAWQDPDPERTALAAIYTAAGGGGWTRSDNWCSDKPLSEWYGVETDEEGHVTALRLSKNNLSGTISEKIAKLTHLRHLDLSWNALEGNLTWKGDVREVCSKLDDLMNLETIDLSHNRLTGDFMPAKWCNFDRLQVINLSSNRFLCFAFPLDWSVFFENGRTVDLILNDNELYDEVPAFIQNHPDWSRLALQFIRQACAKTSGIEYNRDIILPDFTYTDLKDGSQQSIRAITSANKLTMLLNWDPTQEESLRFIEKVVRRFHTLFGPQGFAVVVIVRQGEEYRAAAEQYLRNHDVPWTVVSEYSDTQGRRIILPDYPYPSYLLFDQTGKLVVDMYKGQAVFDPMPGQDTFEIELNSFKHSKFLNKEFEDVFGYGECTYQSTDFSKDKQYEMLQKATKGRGIDVLLMGDGFTDIDIDTGYYREVMEFAMESYFFLEPLKSFRDYFNVYMVYAVSRDYTIGGYDSRNNTAFQVKAVRSDEWFSTYTARQRIPDYCKVCPIDQSPEYFPTVIINGADGGVTYIQSSTMGPNCAFNGFDNVACLGIYLGSVAHESVGHGFGLLADEYTDPLNFERISESLKSRIINLQNEDGRYLNISFTDDPKRVYWSHLIGHPNYPYVGVYEGGYSYYEDVWRSEERSIMRDSATEFYFNTICRELLYRRIMELAGEEYSFDKFLQIDSDEGRPTGTALSVPSVETRYRHIPPVILD